MFYDGEEIRQQTVAWDSGVHLSVRLPKYAVVPVVAVPECKDKHIALKPSGGVFPLHVDGIRTLQLSWENGFLSELLLSCISLGSQLQSINVGRLSREIYAKSEGNPWRIDSEPIKEGIAFGTLSLNRITFLSTFDIPIVAPPGNWYWANPLEKVVQEWSDGVLYLRDVPTGSHCFFSDHMEGRIHLQVDDEGWRAINPITGYGEYGSW